MCNDCNNKKYMNLYDYLLVIFLQANYIEAVRNVPAVKSYALAADTHAKFTESRLKGDANYNMLDTSAVCCIRPRKKKQ